MDHSLAVDLHIAELLRELLDTGLPLLISKDADEIYLGNCGPRPSAATTLEGCLEGLTSHARTKVCGKEGCLSRGRPKPLWSFGADKDSADGHASVCKQCEAKRVSAIGKKKKGMPPPPPEITPSDAPSVPDGPNIV